MYVDTSNITLAGYVENLVFTGSNKMEPSTLKFNYAVYYFLQGYVALPFLLDGVNVDSVIASLVVWPRARGGGRGSTPRNILW